MPAERSKHEAIYLSFYPCCCAVRCRACAFGGRYLCKGYARRNRPACLYPKQQPVLSDHGQHGVFWRFICTGRGCTRKRRWHRGCYRRHDRRCYRRCYRRSVARKIYSVYRQQHRPNAGKHLVRPTCRYRYFVYPAGLCFGKRGRKPPCPAHCSDKPRI